jgi:heat shock protein HslJ
MALEGTVDEEGMVNVTRFIYAWPSQDNERSKADSSPVNTYWLIVSMRGERVPTINLEGEPHVLLKDVDGQGGYSATVGCNLLVGGYAIEGEGLTFKMGASTMMACVPPLDALERTLTKVLAETKRSIKGQIMELYDEAGIGIALLEAVYL